MPRIFLSYRRNDSAGYVGRIYDRLSEYFGKENVFRDIDTLKNKLGVDFSKEIENTIVSCDVLVAIMGKQWLDAVNEQGQRRIDDPEDFVRLEIETALTKNIRTIPLLVGRAIMPSGKSLPESLIHLTRKQALEITDNHFHDDIDLLINSIEESECKLTRKKRSVKHSRPQTNDDSLGTVLRWISKSIKLYVVTIGLLLALIIIVVFGSLGIDSLQEYFRP